MPSYFDTDAASARPQFKSQAVFQSYDGMEGVPPQSPALPATARWRAAARNLYPGVLAAVTIALAATWLSQHYRAPVMLFALLFGMVFHFLHEEGRCIAGIEFSSKAILRVGVALLGARVTTAQILDLGLVPIVLVLVGLVTTLALGAALARAFGISRPAGVLSGGAVAICGASAALAIASVLPRNKDSERDTILTVVIVTLLSTLAMILYPLLVNAIGFDNAHAGVFLGATIHDVAQVVGAGYSISPETGDVATYVKLLRVTMLLPVVFTIAFIANRIAPRGESSAQAPFPFFLVVFALLVALNSFGYLSKTAIATADDVSRWCLVTAIAALGMKTSFKAVAAVGWPPIALMVIETLWIAALSAFVIKYAM